MASIKYAESLLSTMQQMSAVIKFDDIFPWQVPILQKNAYLHNLQGGALRCISLIAA